MGDGGGLQADSEGAGPLGIVSTQPVQRPRGRSAPAQGEAWPRAREGEGQLGAHGPGWEGI